MTPTSPLSQPSPTDGRQPLYRALIRIPLYGGVEKAALGAEAALVAAGFYLFHMRGILLALIVLIMLHPLLVLMYRRDSQLPAILYRHLRQKGRYLPLCA